MFRVIVLLEGEPVSQSQISRWLKKLFPVFSTIHHSLNSGLWLETQSLLMDADFGLMRGVGFAPAPVFLHGQKIQFKSHLTRGPVSSKELSSSYRVTFGLFVDYD